MRAACVALGSLALSMSLLGGGCGGDDACKGRGETCVSLTLLGAEGISQVDQLQVFVTRKAAPSSPMAPLGSPQDLPFKVAVLLPDGVSLLSVRSFLGGTMNGITPEISVELRSGAHDKRLLTLYPPLPGGTGRDMASGGGADMRQPPVDMRQPPVDLRPPADMSTPDMSVGMPDMAMGADMTTAADMAMVKEGGI
jgi:hypothetical protein